MHDALWGLFALVCGVGVALGIIYAPETVPHVERLLTFLTS